MEKNNELKNKSIIIDGDLHKDLKMYCAARNIKIGGIVNNIIKAYIKYPKEINKLIENN